MSARDDGGPAFPTLWQDELRHPVSGDVVQHARSVDPGMTLRDWFAGQALAGLVANKHYAGVAAAALEAYKIADRMLLERAITR